MVCRLYNNGTAWYLYSCESTPKKGACDKGPVMYARDITTLYNNYIIYDIVIIILLIIKDIIGVKMQPCTFTYSFK